MVDHRNKDGSLDRHNRAGTQEVNKVGNQTNREAKAGMVESNNKNARSHSTQTCRSNRRNAGKRTNNPSSNRPRDRLRRHLDRPKCLGMITTRTKKRRKRRRSSKSYLPRW